MHTELIDLPWHIQVALAGGFVGYAIAYTGIRSHHKTIEIAFGSLVFSVIATAVLNLRLQAGADEFWSSAAGIAGAIGAGLLWRVFLRRVFRWALKEISVFSDDDPSAWKRLFDEPNYESCQIAVQLKDGSWVRCDDVTRFKGAPYAPFVLGEAGDVLLYASHSQAPNGEIKELNSTRDDKFGDRVTYIPSAEIKRINIRHRRAH